MFNPFGQSRSIRVQEPQGQRQNWPRRKQLNFIAQYHTPRTRPLKKGIRNKKAYRLSVHIQRRKETQQIHHRYNSLSNVRILAEKSTS